MEENVKIGRLNKSELADRYQVSVKTLMTWISINKNLSQELEKTFYQTNSKAFTPIQVAIIYKYLGEPS